MLQKSSESKPHIHERRSEKVSTVWWTKSTFLGFLMFAALETTPKSSERQVVFWIQGGKHQKHRGGATLGTDPTRKLPSEKVWNIASLLDNSLKANHRWCQLKVDLHFYKSHHLPFHTLWYILQHCITLVPLLREMQTEQLTGALPRKPCARSWSSGPFRAKWLPSFTPDSTTFCHGKAPIFNPMLVDRSQVHWSVPKWLLRVLPMFLGCQMIKCVDWELNSRESYEVDKKFWLILSDVHSHRKQMELN